jgi:TetR/AcrR family transcriptional regulator of autoinduction and epiphytic fitness
MTADSDIAATPDRSGTAVRAGGDHEVRRGRAPAGTDPAKRRQIIEGASRVFSTMGFDAASMNDIAREAGVSKGTLYVYFDHKEELFTALIEDRRQTHMRELFALVDTDDPDVRATLTRFGTAFARVLTSEWALRAQRIVLGVAERMPEVGRGFYTQGPGHCKPLVADYLERMTARGVLSVADAVLAASQFAELCQANLVRPRLYRAVDTPPTDAEIAHVVGHAVEMFLAYYGRPAASTP